jgi:NADPH:quinone reductase
MCPPDVSGIARSFKQEFQPMHAIRYHMTGPPDVLRWEKVDVPRPGASEVLLENRVIGTGLKETGERRGTYPCPPLPAIPGIAAAATVLEIGDDVTGLKSGDRVAYATLPAGSYCEQRVLPADRLVPLPDDIDDKTAAAVINKGITANFLARKTYRIRAGDTVLIHAAAGGVGLLLCQWAKHCGATVIGTVSTEEKAAVARENGCDFPVVYTKEDFVQSVSKITAGAGVPVVYDSVGKDTFAKSLECLQPLGMMVLFGIASGHPPPLELMKFDIWKSYYFTRPSFYVHTRSRDDLLSHAEQVFEMIRSGAVKVTVSEQYPLRDAAEAHRALESRRTTGSVILLT